MNQHFESDYSVELNLSHAPQFEELNEKSISPILYAVSKSASNSLFFHIPEKYGEANELHERCH
jgi:hypothetical protein